MWSTTNNKLVEYYIPSRVQVHRQDGCQSQEGHFLICRTASKIYKQIKCQREHEKIEHELL